MVWTMDGIERPGKVAGANSAGGNSVYKITDVPYILSTMGTRVVSAGDLGTSQSDATEAAYDIYQKADEDKYSYSRLVFRDGLFVGYILIGEPAKAFSKLQSLIQTSADAETINGIIYG